MVRGDDQWVDGSTVAVLGYRNQNNKAGLLSPANHTRPSPPFPSPPPPLADNQGQEGDAATLKQLHDGERATLQLTQPQRYLDPAWRLLASLEASLGCLVGANAYLTPAGEMWLRGGGWDEDLLVEVSRRSRQVPGIRYVELCMVLGCNCLCGVFVVCMPYSCC